MDIYLAMDDVLVGATRFKAEAFEISSPRCARCSSMILLYTEVMANK